MMFHPKGPSFWELARQALSSTRHGYDLLAEKFDYTPFRTPDTVLQATAAFLGRSGPVDALLDLCCGTGAAMRAFRPLVRQRLTGIDFSAAMLAEARKKEEPGVPPLAIEYLCEDVFAMPFRGEFDVAVCFGALGHFLPRDQARFLARVHASLRPGGRFLFTTTDLPRPMSLGNLLSRGFNAAMGVRNALIKPPFIMVYLQFCLPRVVHQLREQGFEVQVESGLYDPPWEMLKLVIATRPPLT